MDFGLNERWHALRNSRDATLKEMPSPGLAIFENVSQVFCFLLTVAIIYRNIKTVVNERSNRCAR
jgi:hypothetical protein